MCKIFYNGNLDDNLDQKIKQNFYTLNGNDFLKLPNSNDKAFIENFNPNKFNEWSTNYKYFILVKNDIRTNKNLDFTNKLTSYDGNEFKIANIINEKNGIISGIKGVKGIKGISGDTGLVTKGDKGEPNYNKGEIGFIYFQDNNSKYDKRSLKSCNILNIKGIENIYFNNKGSFCSILSKVTFFFSSKILIN